MCNKITVRLVANKTAKELRSSVHATMTYTFALRLVLYQVSVDVNTSFDKTSDYFIAQKISFTNSKH
jgi:hypothetical protein